MAGWCGSIALFGARSVGLNALGVLLCTHTMVLAAYLIHEAAHQTVCVSPKANRAIGEVMGFIAGACYASFERIRSMHIRHHLDRADVACFNLRRLLERRAQLRRLLEVLEWAYVPATELLMHLQVVWRPFARGEQRRHLRRAASMLALRLAMLALLGVWSLTALMLYALAVLLQLHVLNLFDAFHHTFEQYFIEPDEPLALDGRDRAYEQSHTYSNLISERWPWLNLLTLNFGYHNAHHERPSVAWHRLPALHRQLFGARSLAVLPLKELLITWHRNRVLRVRSVITADYGRVETGQGRADGYVGAHAVSFLTVI
jgi:fatty acid desaturase